MTASPAQQTGHSAAVPSGMWAEAGRSAVALLQFSAILAVVWCLLFSLNRMFPFARSGADAVYEAKLQMLEKGLNADLVIFGNSKVLTGFQPALFDRLAGTQSFNLGLPNEKEFLDNLQTLTSRGRAPRIVLLTLTDAANEPETSIFHYLDRDRATMNRLFPFRHFPRDLVQFLLLSRQRGGPVAFYRKSSEVVRQMKLDRGYYFIEGQNYFPGHTLPAGLRFSTDTPDVVDARHKLSAAALTRLGRIAERHGTEIWLVPTYHRPGEYAPAPPENVELTAMLHGNPHVHLAGPDYWILPLDCFSDLVHLNPHGAEEYTRRLAALLASTIH